MPHGVRGQLQHQIQVSQPPQAGGLIRLTVLWCREREEGLPLAETACTRLPVEICGAGCTYRDGEQECHNKVHQ